MKTLGKYEVIAEIGTGSMGTIYRGRDQVLDREVALKVLRTEGGLEPELKERFYREARACAKLAHPSIIMVYDLGEADGTVYIAMELLSGSDLRAILRENRTFSLAAKLEIMAQVCDALAHAHQQQLVHRDIKPSNIFLCDDGRAKVLDFGIAKLPTSNLTIAGKVLGSPNYMAPEQIRGGKCDSRSDLFSAAIVFCEFLTLSHPFMDDFIPRRIVGSPPDSLRRKNPEIPEQLEALLLLALEKDPNKRIQTAEQFAAGLRSALQTFSSGIQPQAAPVPLPETLAVAAPAPPDDAAEHRVTEFISVVGDFDEAIAKRDRIAAYAAVERMRELAKHDTRFDIAVSDCAARVREVMPEKEPPPAVAPEQLAAPSSPVPAPAINQVAEPVPPPKPPPPGPAKTIPAPIQTAVPDPAIRKYGALAVALLILITIGAVIFVRNRTPKDTPAATVPVAVSALPAVATAKVAAETAGLFAAANPSGQPLSTLQRGQVVNVLALPSTRDQEYTSAQIAGPGAPSPAGFVKTADLSEWSGASSETAFAVNKLFAPAITAAEDELNGQVEKWNQFFTRFPASPQTAEASLDLARLELALGKLGKSSGKPPAEWKAHLDRAKEALARVTGPALESETAQLSQELSELGGQAAVGSLTPDQILRGRVTALWEAGKYQQAMRLVDQILAATPGHVEALKWKVRLRAALAAEANL